MCASSMTIKRIESLHVLRYLGQVLTPDFCVGCHCNCFSQKVHVLQELLHAFSSTS